MHVYCEKHTSPVSAILQELDRETHVKTLYPQMLSGPFQGKLLQFISYMIRPKNVLEIGTFTGYSALCFAEGLAPEGMVHTIEMEEERAWIIEKYIKKARFEDKITLYLGDAGKIIPTMDIAFDLVFLDGNKDFYPEHFELAFAKTRPGGFLLVDNVLWSGKVLQENIKDPTTLILQNFNDKIQADSRLENLLLPIRDGLMVVRKL